jgi:hypothetical protein
MLPGANLNVVPGRRWRRLTDFYSPRPAQLFQGRLMAALMPKIDLSAPEHFILTQIKMMFATVVIDPKS